MFFYDFESFSGYMTFDSPRWPLHPHRTKHKTCTHARAHTHTHKQINTNEQTWSSFWYSFQWVWFIDYGQRLIYIYACINFKMSFWKCILGQFFLQVKFYSKLAILVEFIIPFDCLYQKYLQILHSLHYIRRVHYSFWLFVSEVLADFAFHALYYLLGEFIIHFDSLYQKYLQILHSMHYITY